jgi:hypothetical protein
VFSWLAPKIHRNLFNPQSLIYHLTNSPPMRYSLVKVLLTVSPFAPSFFPQLNVFSQSFNSCSQARSAAAETLPRTHCSLFTFRHLSPLSIYRLYAESPPNPFIYRIYANRRGVEVPTRQLSTRLSRRTLRLCGKYILFILLRALSVLFATPILYFQQLARSFAKTPGVGGTSRHSLWPHVSMATDFFVLCFHNDTNPLFPQVPCFHIHTKP